MAPAQALRFFFVALAALASRAGAGEVRVVILAGSSNALGYGSEASALSDDLRLQPDVAFSFEDGVLVSGPRVTSGGVLVSLGPQPNDPMHIVFGAAVEEGFGSEIAAGRALADAWSTPIAIVKVASDGSSLESDWHPDRSSALFDRLVTAATRTAAQLADRGDTAVFAGLLWMQGEVDSQARNSAEHYGKNLARFVRRLRERLDAPDMPVVLGRPRAGIACGPFGCFPFLADVRTAEAIVAANVPGMTIVDTDDLAVQADGVHFTSESQLVLGERFAAALLAIATP